MAATSSPSKRLFLADMTGGDETAKEEGGESRMLQVRQVGYLSVVMAFLRELLRYWI